MVSAHWLRLTLVVGLAATLAALPAETTAQPPDVVVSIDRPADGSSIWNGLTIDITGWAVDMTSAEGGGTGIESVEIVPDAQAGGVGQPLSATYGLPRPDVAQALGRPDWSGSGFALQWTPDGIPNGPVTLRIWADSTQGISRFASVTLLAAPPTPTPTLAYLPTPTLTEIPGLRINPRLGCDIDITLLAPSASYNRPCPTPRATPTP